MRILFVDDEELILRARRREFTNDHDVYSAANAAEAFKVLTDHEIDVVVADYEMPDSEPGTWVLEQAKELRPKAIRILTSGSDPDDFKDFVDSGVAQYFFAKPYTGDVIRDCVAAHLSSASDAG